MCINQQHILRAYYYTIKYSKNSINNRNEKLSVMWMPGHCKRGFGTKKPPCRLNKQNLSAKK